MNNRPNRDNELTAYLNLFAFERLNVFQFNNEQYKLRIDECAKLINQFIDSKLVMDKEFEETIATLSKRIGIYYLLCENNRALGSQYLINYRTIHDVKNKLAAEQETRLTTNTISKDFIENEISYAETLTLIFYGLCNDVRIHENLAQQLKEHLNRYESLEKSIVHAANLSAIEIGKALTYYCIALTAGKNNFYEEAHLAIDCAIALQTRHAEKNFLVLGDLAESQRLKSILFKNQQQLPDAEESIKLSIETWANLNKQCSLIHPQLFEAQQTYAQILQSLKKYTEAVNLLNRTLGEQKNFYHTEMHHSIATTQLILGKILKEDNDLEHAYYELKNALMIATQLALPTTMITENIEDIFQQKQIPQLFRMLSHFPHYAWNQYSTTAAFAPIVTDIKRVIDGIIKETVYLDPAQQDVLNDRCVELATFYCYQSANNIEALKYLRYAESKTKNFFTSNWIINHIAFVHIQMIPDLSLNQSFSEALKKSGYENYLYCTRELDKSDKCLNTLDRAARINHLEEILRLTFYSLYLQALQTYRWGLFNSNNAISVDTYAEKKNCFITATGYLKQAFALYETDNDIIDDNYLTANNLYIAILIELKLPELSSIRERLKKLEKIWSEPDRKTNPNNSLFNSHYGNYYICILNNFANVSARKVIIKALSKYKKSYQLLMENSGPDAPLTQHMSRLIKNTEALYPTFFQQSSSSNDTNAITHHRNSELDNYTPQKKK